MKKNVYSKKYKDKWEKFHEASPEKEKLNSNLNIENINIENLFIQKEFVKTLKRKVLVNIVICILNVIHYFLLMFSKCV